MPFQIRVCAGLCQYSGVTICADRFASPPKPYMAMLSRLARRQSATKSRRYQLLPSTGGMSPRPPRRRPRRGTRAARSRPGSRRAATELSRLTRRKCEKSRKRHNLTPMIQGRLAWSGQSSRRYPASFLYWSASTAAGRSSDGCGEVLCQTNLNALGELEMCYDEQVTSTMR